MLHSLKTLFRNTTRRLGYGVFSLSKDQCPSVFLPGHLKAILTLLRVNCVLDVGANTGQYAKMLRKIGYAGQIVSFEPDPATFETLKKEATIDSKWSLFNIALGDTDETKFINVFDSTDMNSFLEPIEGVSFVPKNATTSRKAVQVKKLDSLIADIVRDIPSPRLFLKLDTQGFDLHVIKGATLSLNNVVAIQSEVSVIPLYKFMPTYIESLTAFKVLGFEPTGFYPVARDKVSAQLVEFDAVFTRLNPASK
jgi:FkbM family methyltransferase